MKAISDFDAAPCGAEPDKKPKKRPVPGVVPLLVRKNVRPKRNSAGGRTVWPVFAAAGVLLAVLASAFAAAADDAPHRLTLKGIPLGVLFTDGKIADLRFTVDLGGDVPLSTHVWAVVGSSERRQRTNEGYWISWNGDTESLIDNHFPVVDGKVVFKVLKEDIGPDNHGVTVSTGYRTPEGLKYGYYGLVPKAGAP